MKMHRVAGLDQIGPKGGTKCSIGHWMKGSAEAAAKPKTIGTRVAMSAGHRRKPLITLAKVNLPEIEP